MLEHTLAEHAEVQLAPGALPVVMDQAVLGLSLAVEEEGKGGGEGGVAN